MKTKTSIAKWYNYYYDSAHTGQLAPWQKLSLDWILDTVEDKTSNIISLGCGRGILIKHLKDHGFSKVYGIDISKEAVKYANLQLGSKKQTVKAVSIEEFMVTNKRKFGLVIMNEVIEHTINPDRIIKSVGNMQDKGNYLLMSFPNYLNLPWLIVRLLAEYLNKPNWINLQPIDRLTNYFSIKNRVLNTGYKLVFSTGGVYFLPPLHNLEKPKFWNKAKKLSFLSFHPVLVFQKK